MRLNMILKINSDKINNLINNFLAYITILIIIIGKNNYIIIIIIVWINIINCFFFT